MNDSDHDLLLVIANDTKWIKDWAIAHEKEDASVSSLIRQAVQKAHERIDETNGKFNWLVIGGLFSVIALAISLWVKP